MDTTLIGALIGAIVSIICVVIGWYFGAYEKRLQQKKEVAALSGALLMEAHASAWHILNTCQILKRLLKDEIVPNFESIADYLPTRPTIYAASGHQITLLGPAAALELVQYHTHLERALARTRLVCNLDGRRVKKAIRLEVLSDTASDWRYVAWTCSQSMKQLLLLSSANLAPKQLENVTWHIQQLTAARGPDFDWQLPKDTTVFVEGKMAEALEILLKG